MRTLTQWAISHHVSAVALHELETVLGCADVIERPESSASQSEAAVQAAVRAEASRRGYRLFRNNVGAGKLESGSFVRFGLANDSPAMNAVVKSADLIGVRPVVIEARHLGHTLGQFVSLECKGRGWRFAGTERETAQRRWAEMIVSMGGHAAFVTDAAGQW